MILLQEADDCKEPVVPEPRRLGVSAQIDQHTFRDRFRQRCYDLAFEGSKDIDALADIAWQAYHEGRKAPRTRAAGPEFENPEYQLSEQWLQARAEIRKAQRSHEDAKGPTRILLSSGATRHLSVQGLCVDGAAVVPLAVLVLSQSFARPDRRLDERNLSALGRGA
nr:hypothetical protein [Peristeroidobacter soli]